MTTSVEAPAKFGLTATRAGTAPRSLFVVTVFVGSFLLFQVQPMVARLALPDLGGASAVWNSAMLVYQTLLLAGYAWAHWLRRFSVRRQVALHLGLLLLACFWLPIGLAGLEPPTGNEVVLFVPMLLLISVGPVILAVSAQAPLMQQWFATTSPSRNPYALYAASNLGSFAGLLAYPLVVEPTLRLDTQRWGWTALYGLLLVLVGVCGAAAVAAVRRAPVPASSPIERGSLTVSKRRIALWLALSGVPSGLMLSTTTHLSTDIMAMPLLWAIPLGLYLLTFTIAFAERRTPARLISRAAPAMLLVGGASALASGGTGNYPGALALLLTLFAVTVAMHSRLYDSRPPAENLTFFYLITSIGGALGGVFCGLVAPLAFDWVYEHPILVIAAGALLPLQAASRKFDLGAVGRRPGWTPTALVTLLVAAAAVGMAWAPTTSVLIGLVAVLVAAGVLMWSWRLAYVIILIGLMCGLGARDTIPASFTGDRARSYFGVYTVREDPAAGTTTLVHGATIHGIELTTPGQERQPTTYYGPTSGAGLVLASADQLFGPAASIGVVGLGAGTLACYHGPGQTWRFFEIDPLIVRIARDSGRFHFLSTCTPDAQMTVGDARLELGKVADDSFDVLAVDAFSSDAIPMHLMTREAFETYDRVVRDDGIVLVHISNRFIDLEPVLRGLVVDAGWSAAVRVDLRDSEDMETHAYTESTWVAMSRRGPRLASVTERAGEEWRPLSDRRDPESWTDDFASVLSILK